MQNRGVKRGIGETKDGRYRARGWENMDKGRGPIMRGDRGGTPSVCVCCRLFRRILVPIRLYIRCRRCPRRDYLQLAPFTKDGLNEFSYSHTKPKRSVTRIWGKQDMVEERDQESDRKRDVLL